MEREDEVGSVEGLDATAQQQGECGKKGEAEVLDEFIDLVDLLFEEGDLGLGEGPVEVEIEGAVLGLELSGLGRDGIRFEDRGARGDGEVGSFGSLRGEDLEAKGTCGIGQEDEEEGGDDEEDAQGTEVDATAAGPVGARELSGLEEESAEGAPDFAIDVSELVPEVVGEVGDGEVVGVDGLFTAVGAVVGRDVGAAGEAGGGMGGLGVGHGKNIAGGGEGVVTLRWRNGGEFRWRGRGRGRGGRGSRRG